MSAFMSAFNRNRHEVAFENEALALVMSELVNRSDDRPWFIQDRNGDGYVPNPELFDPSGRVLSPFGALVLLGLVGA